MAERPNFIIIQAEDAGRALGCYGDPDARTANLDRLARRGCRYDNAFSTAPVCAPSRTTTACGRYAWSMGNHAMRCTLVEPPRTFTEELREGGYYVDWAEKTDFNFEPRPGHADHCWGGHERWRDALARGEFRDQPFLLYTNLGITHESTMWDPAVSNPGAMKGRIHEEWQLPAALRPDPGKVRVPAYLPDTLEVRTNIARFYEAVALMDQQVGRILEALDASGQREETYVLFLSDHGRGLAREKRWLYGAGIHLSLLLSGPGIGANTVSERLVSWVDLAPTVLGLAGVAIPEDYEGVAFWGQAEGPERECVYAGRDRMDETFDRSRAVRDREFHYIRNYYPEIPWMPNHHYMNFMGTTHVMRTLHAQKRLRATAAGFLAAEKPVEELYDPEADPDMVVNLAGDARYGEVLERMRGRLEAFQAEVRDLGEEPERALIERGILTDRLEEYRQRLAPLPESFALGGHRMPLLEMPESGGAESGDR